MPYSIPPRARFAPRRALTVPRPATVAASAATVAALIGVLTLVGWAIDVPALRSILPGAVQMKANTAIGVIAASAALAFASRPGFARNPWPTWLFAAFVSLLGAATLAQRLFGYDFAIDQLVVRDTAAAFNAAKGRMSPYAGAAFALLGAAIGLLGRPRAALAARALAVLVLAISVVAIIGYLWNAHELVTDRIATPAALNSVVALALLSAATLWLSLAPALEQARVRANRRLQSLVLAGFVLTALLLVVGGGFTYQSGANFAQAAERIAHSQAVRVELARLHGALVDAQSAQRDRVLLDAPHLALVFDERAGDARRHLAALAGRVADNPAQAGLQRELAGLVERRLALLERIGKVFERQGADVGREALVFDAGIALMVDIRKLDDRMDAAENDLLLKRELRAAAQRSATLLSLLVTLAVTAALSSLLFAGIRREMVARGSAEEDLQRLNANLEQRVADRTEALSHQQAFLRRVIDVNPNLIFAKDADGHFVLVNQALADFYGTTVEALVGKTDHDFNPDRAEVEKYLRADRGVLASGREEVIEAEQITNAAGQARWLTTVKRPLAGADGEKTILLGVSVDITVRKHAEAVVSELTHDLERRVEDRTRDLYESNRHLEQARLESEAANRAKSAFLANMSHEIRTPLNAIIGLTHLLRREVQEARPLDRLAKVSDAAHHLLDVINDVLDLSKIESGKLELDPADFSLESLVTKACALVAGEAAKKGVELVIDTDGLPPMLHGDSTRLSQALVNLLGNAVKFTSQGSVTLRGERLAHTDEETADGRLRVRFSVRDTGIGIAPERIGTLFNAFEQADNSMSRRFGGTGLGLSITRQLARLMGGEAGAESEPGVGSTFWFTARLAPATQTAEPQRDGIALAGKRCLLVDDLPEAREALRHMLEQIGLRVDAAGSGMDALCLAETANAADDPYALALVDWQMPGLDGVETCSRLLARARLAPLRCVMATAYDQDRVRAAAREAGVGQVLAKPVSASTLHDALVSVLAIDEAAPAARGGPAIAPGRRNAAPGEGAPMLRAAHAGARLLVAEDNVVNQEVAVSLLEIAGLLVDVADNGRQAVEKARRNRYDLILMDMQMPELDGLGATRQLRGDPGASLGAPIIAMTANAFGEDRATCLAAGMNDHVAKPVSPEALYATLMHWLPARAASG